MTILFTFRQQEVRSASATQLRSCQAPIPTCTPLPLDPVYQLLITTSSNRHTSKLRHRPSTNHRVLFFWLPTNPLSDNLPPKQRAGPKSSPAASWRAGLAHRPTARSMIRLSAPPPRACMRSAIFFYSFTDNEQGGYGPQPRDLRRHPFQNGAA